MEPMWARIRWSRDERKLHSRSGGSNLYLTSIQLQNSWHRDLNNDLSCPTARNHWPLSTLLSLGLLVLTRQYISLEIGEFMWKCVSEVTGIQMWNRIHFKHDSSVVDCSWAALHADANRLQIGGESLNESIWIYHRRCFVRFNDVAMH